MPTYEYICDACQAEFEKFQSIKADAITLCPACGQERVRRKISTGAGILFKGGGFYETDYRSAGYNEAKKKDSGGDTAKSEPKPESTLSESPKTDSRSEAKPSSAPTGSESKPTPVTPKKD